tara:strand:+ start:246 stop:1127 length:882 start_codon:yes stop_codon:yes gene_type:complete
MTRYDPRIGVVGLGAIGLPMAVNLHRAGFALQVHTRSRTAERSADLESAVACASPALVAQNVDVLLVCVSDDSAVEEVLFGADGAAASLRKGCVVLDCSTIAPATAIACAERLANAGIHYLDAPVTGGSEGAVAGTLTLLVGGETEALDRARPLLEVIGSSIHHFGSVGMGQQVKAVNQVLVAGSYAAVAEAIALGQRLQLPMDAVVTALKKGAAGSWALSHRSTAMLEGEYPLGFRLDLHHKDLNIALSSGRDVGLEMPVTHLVQQLEAGLISRGYGNEDVSTLRRFYDGMP